MKIILLLLLILSVFASSTIAIKNNDGGAGINPNQGSLDERWVTATSSPPEPTCGPDLEVEAWTANTPTPCVNPPTWRSDQAITKYY